MSLSFFVSLQSLELKQIPSKSPDMTPIIFVCERIQEGIVFDRAPPRQTASYRHKILQAARSRRDLSIDTQYVIF